MEQFDEEAAKALSPANTLLISLLPFIKQFPIGPGKHIIANRRGVEKFHKDFFDECKVFRIYFTKNHINQIYLYMNYPYKHRKPRRSCTLDLLNIVQRGVVFSVENWHKFIRFITLKICRNQREEKST